MDAITPDVIAEHGLGEEEYKNILAILNREPNLTELGIFSVMWSEHCSYKSSKKWLKTLPTDGPRVICGPGENAGVVDIGDGQAAIFKMESHNHPSFIEPYQGAATGVGGILRDVFTMGARPVANLNALRFGEPDHPPTKHLISGVVAGIGGYGNCVGVPTIGGECAFDKGYNGNILVNAMTVGIADRDKIFYSAAAGIGNPIVYVGSKTGRDGIHGATMASAEFSEDADEKRPTVQVGDPFTEKLLIESCLELMQTDIIVAIQDMGAAGLTSSSFEMASKGGVGVELDLDRVPRREENMTAYEMMLSESQERMLMVIEPGREDEARKIFEKWALDFAVIGKLTDTGHMILRHKGEVVADLPIDPLAVASPEYDRPWEATPAAPTVSRAVAEKVAALDAMEALKSLMGSPDIASKRWIFQQYDHMVMGDTVQRPGGDAGVVRVHGTNKAIAATSDCTPRYCLADPVKGGRQAVAEAWRNLTAVGAEPLAVTDNMNFGNPERPRVMGQFVGCIEGMRDACRALSFPVVSGNVSLYNETDGQGIPPTPTIGAIGLLNDATKAATAPFKAEGEDIVVVGATEGWLGCSKVLDLVDNQDIFAPPPVDLEAERRNGDFVRGLINGGFVSAVHDCSDGGLLVALGEMAVQSGIGASIAIPEGLAANAYLFGEDQARYVITTNNADATLSAALDAAVPAERIGRTGGGDVEVDGLGALAVSVLEKIHEDWLPNLMEGP